MKSELDQSETKLVSTESEPPKPVLELFDVGKTYTTEGAPVHALVRVSLQVLPGEFVAIVGRSGCGKSTLLHLAGAMDFPTSGEVRIASETTSTLDDRGLTRLRRDKIGFVFQSFQLLQTLSVVENVELPLLLAGEQHTRERALESLTSVELCDKVDRMPHQLSGGQMQRVAIARALIHRPQLLLADEPTGNLDSSTADGIMTLLRRIARDQQAAILMATHSLDSIACADRVVYLRDGRVERIQRQ
ncbi:MAG TPA: ABC transporter ATP-binding protein [Candidatus Acidoferrales bacterium]|nr:ABC transporter ATP-binding protein [Candidatus Acidoferrales bacterium]